MWKQGEWSKYKSFLEYFNNKKLVKDDNEVINVHSAFARHLQNPEQYPIYDQHALRAIWAIDKKIWEQGENPQTAETGQLDTCDLKKHFFENKNINENENNIYVWRTPPSHGHQAIYKWFIDRVNKICEITENGITHKHLDDLLMPLGKAIKEQTKKPKKQNKNQDNNVKNTPETNITQSDPDEFDRFKELCYPQISNHK